ncbi:AMP-binding protein [Anaerocolumna xylanovorans]|uniref:1-acyl-sn-glycerol-3-phosphate acyltransferases n=1 Tax=Anaerocolumna xylanovorans DSM 12503 TaxID=1121345 RepID=A0A1M7YLN9_9FIRM|nr:AMP-binding protein [Anaerocolumna xylanovorans]SHO53544.1 1-acyl-sn-glycerol-3-phosphate acyltransferases [Anaerocolumna xylanovorans DSM 12503]
MKSFCDMLLSAMKEFGDNNMLYYKRENGNVELFTGNEFCKRIQRAEELFVKLGLSKGDRILISSPTSPYYLFAFLGAVKAGIVPMLIDYSITKEEYSALLELGEVKTIVTIGSQLPKIPQEYYEMVPIIEIVDDVTLYDKSIEQVSSSLPKTTEVHEEVAFILFSSGTTSKMKGVEMTFVSQTLMFEQLFPKIGVVERKTHVLLVLPLFHVAGLAAAFAAIYSRSKLYMVENVNPIKISNVFIEFNPTFVVLVPKIYEAFMNKVEQKIAEKPKIAGIINNKLINLSLLVRKKYNINLGKYVFASIRKQMFGKNMMNLMSGGTALNPKVLNYFNALGYDIINVYATTETNVGVISTELGKYDSIPTGKVTGEIINVKLINIDPDGIGELVVKSPCLFRSYFKDQEATNEAFTEDGYFKTGDLAISLGEDRYKITGRRKEAILLQNGEKISPEAIEEVYTKLKVLKNLNFAVCGVQYSNETEYDTVVMFIEGDILPKEQAKIRQYLMFENGSIPSNYRVSKLLFIDKLPKTSVGKVRRFDLKQIAIDSEKGKKEIVSAEKCVDDLSGMEGKVKKSIRKCSTINLEYLDILPEMNLYNNLAYDSLSMFQLCLSLEETFGKDYSAFFSADTTVQDVYNMIDGKESTKVELEYDYDAREYPILKNKFDTNFLKFIEKIFIKTYKISYIGKENIPLNTPVIFCPNHISELDPILVLSAFNEKEKEKIYCFCWDKFTATKLKRYFLRLVNGLPIDRRSIGNATNTLRFGTEFIRQGKSLVIFPEGTRTYDGNLANFQNGAALLAKNNDIPIVPVTLIGVYDAYSKARKGLHFRKNGKRIKIKVIFSKPIYGTDESACSVINSVKDTISKNLYIQTNK